MLDPKVLIGSAAILAGFSVTTSVTQRRSKKGRGVKMGLRAVVGGRMAVAAAFVGGHVLASAGVAASS
jgi:hypothetical protein